MMSVCLSQFSLSWSLSKQFITKAIKQPKLEPRRQASNFKSVISQEQISLIIPKPMECIPKLLIPLSCYFKAYFKSYVFLNQPGISLRKPKSAIWYVN